MSHVIQSDTFICSVFNDVISDSVYTVLDVQVTVTNELKRQLLHNLWKPEFSWKD
jgi:hypothetical protein